MKNKMQLEFESRMSVIMYGPRLKYSKKPVANMTREDLIEKAEEEKNAWWNRPRVEGVWILYAPDRI